MIHAIRFRSKSDTRPPSHNSPTSRRYEPSNDSLSDFLSIADAELVVSYLRHMVVEEEEREIFAIYLLWPEVLEAPLNDQYLSWFFTKVLRLRRDKEQILAELQNDQLIGAPAILSPDLALTDTGLRIDTDRVAKWAEAVKSLDYQAIPFSGSTFSCGR